MGVKIISYIFQITISDYFSSLSWNFPNIGWIDEDPNLAPARWAFRSGWFYNTNFIYFAL